METKFYEPKTFHWLTMAQEKGITDESLIQDNIARMILMSKYDLSAKEAQEMLDEMGGEDWSRLMESASWNLNEPKMQDYLVINDLTGHRLYPIAEVLSDPEEPQLTEEEAEAIMWDRLDEMDWETFEETELSSSEWD